MLSSGNAQLSLCRFLAHKKMSVFARIGELKNNDNEMIFHYKPGGNALFFVALVLE